MNDPVNCDAKCHPSILLVNISRNQDAPGGGYRLNNQGVTFNDKVNVSWDGATQVYTLIGYVLFIGNGNKSGHYTVICREKKDYWFKYDDDKTVRATDFDLSNKATNTIKRQVILLVYAKQSYYNTS